MFMHIAWEPIMVKWPQIEIEWVEQGMRLRCRTLQNCIDKQIIFHECNWKVFAFGSQKAIRYVSSIRPEFAFMSIIAVPMSVILIDCNSIKSSTWALNQLSKSILYARTTCNSIENCTGEQRERLAGADGIQLAATRVETRKRELAKMVSKTFEPKNKFSSCKIG